MLNDPRSHGLWEQTAPAAPATEKLSGDHSVAVAVIGGGFTGMSAALHLARAGMRVAVIEAVEIGFGGAGRNVGLVNAGMWVMPEVLLRTLPAPYGERLLNLLGDGPKLVFDIVRDHGILCEAVHAGTLHCAHGQSGFAEITARARQWQARGADVELLDADRAARLLGTRRYAGALLDRRAGTIQPLAYVRGLATAAQKAGARLFTQSPVTAIERQGDQWQIRTAHGRVTADWVILSTDAYGSGPGNPARREQVPLPYFNFATRPLSAEMRAMILPEGQGAWDTQMVMNSFRMDRAGRLVFGSIGALRGSGAAVHRAWAKRALRKLFPGLGPEINDVDFEAEWYGTIGMTADNLPRFHRYGPRMIGFSGYNGRGIAPGTVFGRVLASYVRGEIDDADLPLPITPVAAAPFRLPKQIVYEAGAQAVHLVADRI
ncbi:MAG: NAD(P)/FAD-dependent oxidoreductase [Ferrovibrio sp.]|uniref:NAD(P)/FAD-dependent oxidoreductase n=1 Tax=Ferrovibrio sp. TaxID=1917215 RepID=UPI00391B1BC2